MPPKPNLPSSISNDESDPAANAVSHDSTHMHESTKADLMKSWSQKLLVMALCALSFYAGWQAHHSSMVRHCLQSGGQVSESQGIFNCQWAK